MVDTAIEELAKRVAISPNAGAAGFEYASALDAAAREAEASAVHRQALAWPLPAEIEYRLREQLASSLRTLSKIGESVAGPNGQMAVFGPGFWKKR